MTPTLVPSKIVTRPACACCEDYPASVRIVFPDREEFIVCVRCMPPGIVLTAPPPATVVIARSSS